MASAWLLKPPPRTFTSTSKNGCSCSANNFKGPSTVNKLKGSLPKYDCKGCPLIWQEYGDSEDSDGFGTVSYTHMKLPTNR